MTFRKPILAAAAALLVSACRGAIPGPADDPELSRSSFERVGHEVGTLYRWAQTRIEEELIQEHAVPAEARSVRISIDRVARPMEEPTEAPPVPVDPPWVAAASRATSPRCARSGPISRWPT